jgi:hypothetical protein
VVVVVFVVGEIVVVEDEVALAEVQVVVVEDGVGLVAGAVEEAEEEEVEEEEGEDVEVMEDNYDDDDDQEDDDDSVLVHKYAESTAKWPVAETLQHTNTNNKGQIQHKCTKIK